MSQQALATTDDNAAIMERVLIAGDLEKLAPADRVAYYAAVCRSVGLNPMTKPFEYIRLNGKLTLYALKGATDQLRENKGISIVELAEHNTGDLYIVWATARDAAGRVDKDMGAASIKGLQGDALVNAMMKAITKAKRRVTLSLAGLGWLDESEVASIPSAERAPEFVQELSELPVHTQVDEPVRGIVDVLSDELDGFGDLPESYFDDDGRLLAPPVTGNPEDDIPTMLDLLDQANNPKRYTQARDYITQIGLHVDPAIAGIMEERDAKLAARRRAAVTA